MIRFLDTTLRDGEQSPGFSMTPNEKRRMALQLEALGVDIIEAGFPAASKGDAAAVAIVAETVSSCTVAALARAVKKDIDEAAKALRSACKPRIHVFLATSDIHLKYKLRISRDTAIRKIRESVAYAASLCDDVEFSAEDATRTDADFLIRAVETAIEAGAKTVNLPDTVGYSTPDEIKAMVSGVIAKAKGADSVCISVHCHNDLGLAAANTLAGLEAGATQAECTVTGIGERAGNAAVEEVAMAISTRKDRFNFQFGLNTTEIVRTARLLSSISGIQIYPAKAVVGRNAFSHESGIHQHGLLTNSATYEILTPESVGITDTSLVLGKHSGRHAFSKRLCDLGYDLSETQTDSLFESFKKLADRKKKVTDRDLMALAESCVEKTGENQPLWSLDHFVVNSGNRITSTALVALRRKGKTIEEVATGTGPVYAAFKALEKIVHHPFKLDDYQLQAVTERRDALGEARVSISDDKGVYRGRGLSTDVIEASILACVDALNKMVSGDSSL